MELPFKIRNLRQVETSGDITFMNYHHPSFNTDRATVMTMEQLDQVVDAILAGKYSWACLLILRFVGYNPMHYIPYRTYNRLVKENLQSCHPEKTPMLSHKSADSPSASKSDKRSASIEDLAYLEPLDRQKVQLTGGRCSAYPYESIFSIKW